MRLFLACCLVACGNSNPVDDVVQKEVDATTRDSANTFPDGNFIPEAEAGPVYNGGPLACGTCWCDGTLYACAEGACFIPPPTKDAGADGSSDAGDAGDAGSCGKGVLCMQIPTECLPKPTCDCIEKATGFRCMVTPNGNGFALSCN